MRDREWLDTTNHSSIIWFRIAEGNRSNVHGGLPGRLLLLPDAPVRFQWKNPDLLIRNLDFLLKILNL